MIKVDENPQNMILEFINIFSDMILSSFLEQIFVFVDFGICGSIVTKTTFFSLNADVCHRFG